jgi:hypothetical protein
LGTSLGLGVKHLELQGELIVSGWGGLRFNGVDTLGTLAEESYGKSRIETFLFAIRKNLLPLT